MISQYLNQSSFAKSVLISGSIIGVLDGLAAITSAYLSKGVTPDRVFQFVASGALGRDSFQGGVATVLIGVMFHFFIATSFTAFFFWIASIKKQLLDQLFITGALYGVSVWLTMQYAVIPLSRITPGRFNPVQAAIGIGIHIFVIGIPIVWLATQHLRATRD